MNNLTRVRRAKKMLKDISKSRADYDFEIRFFFFSVFFFITLGLELSDTRVYEP